MWHEKALKDYNKSGSMQIILTNLFRLLLALITNFNLLQHENDGDVVVLCCCNTTLHLDKLSCKFYI